MLLSYQLVRTVRQMRHQQLLPCDGVSVTNQYFKKNKSVKIDGIFNSSDDNSLFCFNVSPEALNVERLAKSGRPEQS
jgi:hypothetical protein